MMINFKPKCIIFSRVSTSTQSLESQNAILYQHAHKEGYDDSEIKLIEQTESAVLNDIDNRIGIQQLFRMIEETPSIKCVIVFEISRIGRRPDVLYKVRDYLLERKIQLICIKPEIRLLDENGNFSQSANLIFSSLGVFERSASECLIPVIKLVEEGVAETPAALCGA